MFAALIELCFERVGPCNACNVQVGHRRRDVRDGVRPPALLQPRPRGAVLPDPQRGGECARAVRRVARGASGVSTMRCVQVRFPRALSGACRALLAGLLTKEPASRLGAGPDDAHEIMTHPFFASVNWAELVAKKIPPPFKPQVESETDTRYFDSEFTGESVELTPPESDAGLARIQEEQFPQFSYQVNHCSFKLPCQTTTR